MNLDEAINEFYQMTEPQEKVLWSKVDDPQMWDSSLQPIHRIFKVGPLAVWPIAWQWKGEQLQLFPWAEWWMGRYRK